MYIIIVQAEVLYYQNNMAKETCFLYRSFRKSLGCFYNGDEWLLPQTLDSIEAKWRWKQNKKYMQKIKVSLPPQQIVEMMIPVREEWEEDLSFEERMLSDIRIDPKIRILCNKILTKFKYCTWWFFVLRDEAFHTKMHTKNMEVLQLMKDVIMWFVRYDPIRLDYDIGRGAKKKRIQTDRDIAENLEGLTYMVGDKKYKTDIYWVYTRKLRKAMFQHHFNFYWDHELQYFQRDYDLNYGAINYMCASRNSGKCTAFGSMVRMWDGSSKKAEDIELWDKLLASDGKWFVDVIEKEYFKKECVEIELNNWLKKTVSTDHRIPLPENYSRDWRDLDIDNYRRADSLTNDDILATGEYSVVEAWDYNWSSVKQKTNKWQQDVVHIRVTGDSCYRVNGILTHNTFYGLYNTALPMFKSPTSLREFADPANFKCHFFVKSIGVIENYSEKLKDFFYNLLVKTYKLDEQAANQIVEWKTSRNTMYLHTADWDRPFEFVSELASSRRWERSARATLDECNYLKNYEDVSDFATKSGAGTVNYISTISVESKTTDFYKGWTKAMIKARQAQPIEEIIHHVWTKYGFDKIKSTEEYRQMALDGVFDEARAEYYSMRTVYAQKVTLDDVEYKTEQEKKVDIESSIESITGYDGMLAEFFCELSPEKAEINYRPNIVEAITAPKHFDKIYAGYDEAEWYDDATLVVGWVINRKLYTLAQYILPVQVGQRYAKINDIMSYWQRFSKHEPSLILDIGRGPIYFRETSSNVKRCDMAIKARSWRFEKISAISWVSYYSVGTELLVQDMMNSELLWGDMCFLLDTLSSDIEIETAEGPLMVDWLFWQLDNYVKQKGSYKGKNKKRDDLVSARLYMAYYAWSDAIKEWAIISWTIVTDPLLVMDAQREKQQRSQIPNRKPAAPLRNIR